MSSLRIEDAKNAQLITGNTREGRAFFAGNKDLQNRIKEILAINQARHGVELFAIVFLATHYHFLARFPKGNCSKFMKDVNSALQKAVKKFVREFGGGRLLQGTYKKQAIPLIADVQDKFFYCAFQAVKDGLARYPENYPAYNSQKDAKELKDFSFQGVDWVAYRRARLTDKSVAPKMFEKNWTLHYSKLPGLTDLDDATYKAQMKSRMVVERQKVLEKRKKEGKSGFMTKASLEAIKPGTRILSAKANAPASRIPVLICSCPATSAEFLDDYYETKRKHKEASTRYRNGIPSVTFPTGTYPPPLMVPASESTHFSIGHPRISLTVPRSKL